MTEDNENAKVRGLCEGILGGGRRMSADEISEALFELVKRAKLGGPATHNEGECGARIAALQGEVGRLHEQLERAHERAARAKAQPLADRVVRRERRSMAVRELVTEVARAMDLSHAESERVILAAVENNFPELTPDRRDFIRALRVYRRKATTPQRLAQRVLVLAGMTAVQANQRFAFLRMEKHRSKP